MGGQIYPLRRNALLTEEYRENQGGEVRGEFAGRACHGVVPTRFDDPIPLDRSRLPAGCHEVTEFSVLWPASARGFVPPSGKKRRPTLAGRRGKLIREATIPSRSIDDRHREAVHVAERVHIDGAVIAS